MTRVTYTPTPSMAMPERIRVAWAILRGKSIDYEVNSSPGFVECEIVRASRGEPVIDLVAGEIHPWPTGPCAQYVPDGRSDICMNCDWSSGAHNGGDRG